MKTYDIIFDKIQYDLYANNDDCAWWNFSIYDNNGGNVLGLHQNVVSITEHKDNYASHRLIST